MVYVKANISVDDACFLGTALEGVFYGGFVVLYAVFRYVRAQKTSRDYFSGSITILFALCTLYFATDVAQQYMTILPDAVNPEVAYRINIFGSICFSLVDFVSQMILIFRCFLLWDRNFWIVLLPATMSFATLGGEFGMVGLLASVAPADVGSIIDRIMMTGLVAFSVSLAVNTLTTCLIVLRILMMSREIGQVARGRHVKTAVALIVESGLLTFAVQLIWVVLFSLEQHPAWYLVMGPSTMIYGLTPTILAVRVGTGTSYESTKINAFSTYGSGKHSKGFKESGVSMEFQTVTNVSNGSVEKV